MLHISFLFYLPVLQKMDKKRVDIQDYAKTAATSSPSPSPQKELDCSLDIQLIKDSLKLIQGWKLNPLLDTICYHGPESLLFQSFWKDAKMDYKLYYQSTPSSSPSALIVNTCWNSRDEKQIPTLDPPPFKKSISSLFLNKDEKFKYVLMIGSLRHRAVTEEAMKKKGFKLHGEPLKEKGVALLLFVPDR